MIKTYCPRFTTKLSLSSEYNRWLGLTVESDTLAHWSVFQLGFSICRRCWNRHSACFHMQVCRRHWKCWSIWESITHSEVVGLAKSKKKQKQRSKHFICRKQSLSIVRAMYVPTLSTTGGAVARCHTPFFPPRVASCVGLNICPLKCVKMK